MKNENNDMSFEDAAKAINEKTAKKLERIKALLRCQNKEERDICELKFRVDDITDLMGHYEKLMGKVTTLIEGEHKRITRVQDDIYDLCPDKDIIDTMAENEEEREEIMRRVMNTRSLDDVSYEMTQEFFKKNGLDENGKPVNVSTKEGQQNESEAVPSGDTNAEDKA